MTFSFNIYLRFFIQIQLDANVFKVGLKFKVKELEIFGIRLEELPVTLRLDSGPEIEFFSSTGSHCGIVVQVQVRYPRGETSPENNPDFSLENWLGF